MVITKKPTKKVARVPTHLSTGSTLLNLACSGTINGGFPMGQYVFFVGDSDSGKTFLCLTCLAEACRQPGLNGHRLIYDGAEGGAMMDHSQFFGTAVTKRLEEPSPDGASFSIEDFYDNVTDAIEDGRPFIYILDSMDCLTSESELDKHAEQKKARRKGKEVPGSYGDGKAKTNSAHIRKLIRPLAKSKSLLIIINQTRDNVGTMSMDKKTRSGGRSLKFYAALEMWSSSAGSIKRTIRGKPRELGIFSKVQVKKNRLTGKKRTVTVPISHTYGVDDIRSCINYLVDEKHWSGNLTSVKAPEFDFNGKINDLIKHIEANEMELDLRDLAGTVWTEIEEACKAKRKRRYE